MQFINIVVHSVEDMNFRVHLQYDFTKLCLDDYLDVSREMGNSPELRFAQAKEHLLLPVKERSVLKNCLTAALSPSCLCLCVCFPETKAHRER